VDDNPLVSGGGEGRPRRAEFAIVDAVANSADALGIALMALPTYGALWIWPPWPANLITVLSFAWMLVGLVAGYRLRSRSGEMLERVGRLLAS
jgi:hypothetical protein